MASAAADAGVRHFVYSSAGIADRNSGIPHFESKWRIEEYIRSPGLPATVLRPAAFMDNFAAFSFRTIMLCMWRTYVPEDRTLQLVAVEDIGGFAARAFHEPELAGHGIETHVIHSSSMAVSREHRRAKTDQLDTAMLLRVFMGWLRGERGHCGMVAVPTIGEEDAKRPHRERENLVGERTRISNRMKAALIRLDPGFQAGAAARTPEVGRSTHAGGFADPSEHTRGDPP